MFKIVMKHTELQCLTWQMGEFSRLVADGSVRRPEGHTSVWRITLQVKAFGKFFYIPLCEVK